MLQPEAYLMARHEARFHVLVEVVAARPAERTPGRMPIEARVVEAYRSDGTLRAGDLVRFQENVMRPGDEIPCGGVWWKQHDEVLQARYIEAFLDGDPPNCAVVLSQSQIVASPDGTARMEGWFPLAAIKQRALQALAEREASGRRWWRFWR
ncbi:MAG: hypothetical protein ACKVX9_24555 [Blastocatellia bacterium]